jgi:ComF family protein
MKYYGRPDVARMMGATAARRFSENGFFYDIDAVVPVPLSRRRQWQRGYNQSTEIAHGVADVTGLPVLGHVLRRTTFHQSQTHLGAQDRRENVEGAFALRDAEAIRGKHLLIVDDVVTTGSTIMACGNELLRAEGVRLSILSLGFTHS